MVLKVRIENKFNPVIRATCWLDLSSACASRTTHSFAMK
jgi:hypothetical protein